MFSPQKPGFQKFVHTCNPGAREVDPGDPVCLCGKVQASEGPVSKIKVGGI